MSNRLSFENSPYLLQHKDNPVDWYPWGKEALEKARQEDKPVFLSIGYAACHWCHVMAHESFEDAAIASLMNRFFINIKVDREERPDLDSIYMNAVVTMTGNGGWPLSVFLTPEGQPFFGGTYFPPVRRYNLLAFRDVLLNVARAWESERGEVIKSSQNLARHLKTINNLDKGQGQLDRTTLDQAVLALAQSYDWEKGGWGSAPKFPQPMAIEFLLRRAGRGDQLALDMAVHALGMMCKGGMYDVVSGGFARYSTDDHWLVPHFEKMLYDNAQLALAYLHGYLLCKDKGRNASTSTLVDVADFALIFHKVCEETLDFVLQEMTGPEGGFYSSLDADSEGEEGKFYLWTPEEIRQAVGDPDMAEIFLAAYGVTVQGNFEGRTVLQRVLDDEQLSTRFGLSPERVGNILTECRVLLVQARSQRVRPGIDDKVLVSWNALMLVAFAEAARYLKREDYLRQARRSAGFLLQALHPADRLLRSWRDGRTRHNAYLEDYAALILGLLALYQSDPDANWFQAASRLTEEMVVHYRDVAWGFFDTHDDHESLLVRPKDIQDNATPSGNALATMALLQMAAYSGRGEWRDLAEDSLRILQSALTQYPTAFAFWLSAADFAVSSTKETAILGDPGDPRTQALVDVLWSSYHPDLVAAISDYPPVEGAPALLANRLLIDGLPSAYVCQDFVCNLPVNSPNDLRKQL